MVLGLGLERAVAITRELSALGERLRERRGVQPEIARHDREASALLGRGTGRGSSSVARAVHGHIGRRA